MKQKTFLLTVSILTLLSSSSYAQNFAEVSVIENLPFFSCLIAGVLLAVAFQAFFTVLSLATGLSLTPKISEKNIRETFNSNGSSQQNSGNSTPLGVKISGAVGVWTIISASISLFFASFLAVRFSLIPANAFGLTLGLVIWAAFYFIMWAVEWKVASSLMGGIFKLALGGFKNSVNGISGVFGKSDSAQMKDVINHSVEKFADEVEKRIQIDTNQVEKKLDDYVARLEPKEMNYRKARKSLKKVIGDIVLDKNYPATSSTIEKVYFNLASNQSKIKKEDLQQLKQMYSEIMEENSNKDRLTKAFDTLTPGNEEKGKEIRKKITQFLEELKTDELNPEKLEADLEKILENPKDSKAIIQNRAANIDSDVVVDAIVQNTELRKETVQKYSDKLFDIVKAIEQKVGNAKNGNGNSNDTHDVYSINSNGNHDIYNVRDRNLHNGNEAETEDFLTQVEGKFRNFFNEINRPEFEYNRLKNDLHKVFSDEYSTSQVLKKRLNEYDADSVKAILTTHTSLTEEQIEDNTQKVVEARRNFINKVEEAEREIKLQIENAKDKAIAEAEAARKTSIAAAWVAVLSTVISAGASALGGILAYTV